LTINGVLAGAPRHLLPPSILSPIAFIRYFAGLQYDITIQRFYAIYDYLMTSAKKTTATGLADGAINHDQITLFFAGKNWRGSFFG
jgi:hypothetical protein